MIDYALDYANAGWHILPLYWFDDAKHICACGRPNCASPGKHPIGQLTPHGVKDATTEAATLRRWWTMYPTANIGIATGAESGLVVLDIDPRHGGEDAARDLLTQHGDFTTTRTARTGSGGMHLIYRHPGTLVRNSASMLGPGIDVRGDGGYIVAPPSNHESGSRYAWESERSLMEMPAWMMRSDMEHSRTAHVVGETIAHGTQHYTMVSLAGTMRRRGCTAPEIAALLWEVNGRCERPAPRRNIDKIAESICQYAPEEIMGSVLEETRKATDPGAPARFHHLRDVLRERVLRIKAVMESGVPPGVASGFKAIDDMIVGLQPSELVVLAARPSMGKTAMATTLAEHAARNGVRVMVFSIEMARGPLGDRFLSAHSGLNGVWLRNGRLTPLQFNQVVASSEDLGTLPIYINDESAITMKGVRAVCATLPDSPGIIFVDYLQLVQASTRHSSEEAAIAEVSKDMKGLAKHFDCPVVALTQLNRNAGSRRDKRPTLTDLRGSGQIEQDADTVIFLHRPEVYGDTHIDIGLHSVSTEGIVEVIIGKQRNGPIGTVYLRFDKATTRFIPYEDDSPRHALNGHTQYPF